MQNYTSEVDSNPSAGTSSNSDGSVCVCVCGVPIPLSNSPTLAGCVTMQLSRTDTTWRERPIPQVKSFLF